MSLMNTIRAITPKFFENSPLHLDNRGRRLFWLVKLRFLALFLQLPLTLIGRYYGYLNQGTHLFFTLAIIALILLNGHLFRKLITDKNIQISELTLTTQITLDLIVFTVLLALSGDSNNPFYSFFYIMAVLGGIFSSGRSSIIFGMALVLSLLFIQITPILSSLSMFSVMFQQATFPYLLTQLVIPLMTFLIARSFGSLLNSSQDRLIALTVQSERNDRLRALGSLSAGFSHEFASPLQNAKMRLKRVASSIPDENSDIIECQLSIQDCEQVLKKMNRAQLNFTDQDAETVDLELLTKDVITTWSESTENVTINFETKSVEVKLNKINFVQVLFNLLDNAYEASPETAQINISIREFDHHIELSISDNGPGFSPEVLNHLGEPFNTNKDSGTGLGIYTAILFMNSLSGELRVKNNQANGATVALIFKKVSDHE